MTTNRSKIPEEVGIPPRKPRKKKKGNTRPIRPRLNKTKRGGIELRISNIQCRIQNVEINEILHFVQNGTAHRWRC